MSPKTNKVLTIVVEIVFIGLLVNGFVRNGFPDNTIYWIGAVVETIFGVISILLFRSYLHNPSNRQWMGFANLLILVIFILPIIFYYTVDVLKPAGSTWIYGLLTYNTYRIIRIIRKQPVTEQRPVSAVRLITISKVLHWIMLAGILACFIVVVTFAISGKTSVIAHESALQLFFSVTCLVLFALGYFAPQIIKNICKNKLTDFNVYMINAVRISLFFTPAVFGLIIGMTDGLFYASFLLILLSGMAIALTYPNTSRWEKWKGGKNTDIVEPLP